MEDIELFKKCIVTINNKIEINELEIKKLLISESKDELDNLKCKK